MDRWGGVRRGGVGWGGTGWSIQIAPSKDYDQIVRTRRQILTNVCRVDASTLPLWTGSFPI